MHGGLSSRGCINVPPPVHRLHTTKTRTAPINHAASALTLCASVVGTERMNPSIEQVQRVIIKLRVLRTRYAWGHVLVQPVIVPGWT
jgi:hypothetical protein